MRIAGFADTMSEASNDTAEGRAKNRRVDIVIMNHLVVAPKKDLPKGGEAPKQEAAQKK
jgi:hypothetical protein